ncbi:MAG: three-Cys-motif partner protein TcmP [Streptosporangiaceae bacterium]
MSAGARDQYWEQQRLPSVFKHDLLRRYLPVFAGKTGSRAPGVVYLDGFAGRGRYQDHTPASAEHILQIAEQQRTNGINYQLFFYERDPESFAALKPVVDEYAARGVQARADNCEVIAGLDQVVTAAQGMPLFLFLDPCGLGLPFSALATTLSGPRSAKWPPTEVLLNFSLEAVRRISGHVASSTPTEKSMKRLDEALGGDWWRDLVRQGVSDQAVDQIVKGFMERLGRAVGMQFLAVPVRRAPRQKPVYHLVFGTRKTLGIWHFADDVARATETWWNTLDAQEVATQEKNDQQPLFLATTYMRPDLAEVETEARPVIAENIAGLVAERGPCRMGDHPVEVFGEYLGRVRETVVRAAIKDLHESGRTPSDGKGKRPADLEVSPPR